ncbi:acyl-CoA synthetase [Mycolicibacterium duvalii]|uniref:Acyl-CoA synthetase n=1 Tax=Mycolicibacterium duvalii TaxID=39688 RepID=A0A7I7JV90_9MYCO|nr:AMP-binding protein [Mycolicibacterium duvalii]MCV7370115.1 AMP-binding protein [Mycolicibacterium duvalii]PEG40850.1 acyl-CoA synthetase [Mycolicibacterium duvalii]BBX15720.1 acyl-CoA synthetase [Mycolicibacterium duvalii]
MTESSLLIVLRERASLQPNHPAFTFYDYERDWDGVAETATWAQLHRRSQQLACEIEACASAGDRVVILAPQSLEYVVAFLAALEAGVIAVPLSVPLAGVHDERISAVLRDASPTVILTTAAVSDTVTPYLVPDGGGAVPSVIEVDSLDVDAHRSGRRRRRRGTEIAYLQYTSGSTRTPAGVAVTHKNLAANWKQIIAGYLPDYRMPRSAVSWLPFYHDMGLMLGVCAGVLGGWPTAILSPTSFLVRPARWIQLLARYPQVLSAAPNFAFELAAARTTDDDLAGLDLSDVLYILSGAERVNETTLERFLRRFARANLPASVLRPSYGLAEATLFVATHPPGGPPEFVHFDPRKLAAGHAERCADGTPLVSYGVPQSPTVRIVDPDTATERPGGVVGEIWVRGDNVSPGYWCRPADTEQTFGATIADPTPGTPGQGWLRTGDLGFLSEGELFIVGRIKDILIVRGRNHYPDDIESTIQEISRGRAAAIAVIDDITETLAVIVETKRRGQSDGEIAERLRDLREGVVSAVSNAHGVRIEDVVLVAPGSIPITTSGKVRRAACVELYRTGGFARVD